MLYSVTCNPALDWMMSVDSYSLGATNRSHSDALSVGGKGINVSIVASRLGLKTCATGFVAGITGHALETGLNDMGIPNDFVHLPVGQTRINVKLKTKEPGQGLVETEINGRGPDVSIPDQKELFEKMSILTDKDVLVLSGATAPGCDETFYRRIMELPALEAVPVVVDCTGSLLLNTLDAKPFLIKPNNAELAEISACDKRDFNALLDAAVSLARQGAHFVLISCGGDGAFLVDADGPIARAQAPEGKLVNSVGAGDSMIAGFLAGWFGADFAESEAPPSLKEFSNESIAPLDKRTSYTQRAISALKLGIAAGSATAFSVSLAPREEVMQLLPTISIGTMR